MDVYGQQFHPLDSKTIEQSPLLESGFQRKLDDVTGTELTAGNKLRLLSNGEVSFKEKVRMVKEAKKFFHAVVMVQYCDESSSEIVDAMVENGPRWRRCSSYDRKCLDKACSKKMPCKTS